MLFKFVKRMFNPSDSASLSSRLRNKRFKFFLDSFNFSPSVTILDIGGTSKTWNGSGLENNVTLLNLTKPKPNDINRGFTAVQGNALEMNMFDKEQFDIVFSNSVIEHVGSFKNQLKFAQEAKRVGKGYWIQTPNHSFPIEPHILFPFFQHLPMYLKKKIALNWKYSHLKQWGFSNQRIIEEISQTRLLNYRDMKTLFNDGNIYREKFFGLTKSFIAYKTNNAS